MARSLARAAVAASLAASVLVALPAVSHGTAALAATPAAPASSVADTPVSDANSAPDELTASQIATDFGHAVTVDSATTETQLVQAEPDGSVRMTLDSVPVRVQQDGDWVSTDPTLQIAGGALQPAAAAVPVQFSAGGAGPMAKVQSPSGEWLSESWQGGALPTPSVLGDTATYPDVYPGVDLKLSATDAGMSQVLVIKDAQAAADPQLKNVAIGVDNGSLTTAPSGGGAVTTAADGSTQLTAPVATWWDSSQVGASADGPGGNALSLPVTGAVSDTQISLNAAVPAQKPDVTYPVYVDPDWTATTNLGWATVDATFPTTPYWESTAADSQHVGYIDAADTPPSDNRDHTARSYWTLDTSRVTGRQINSASFHATMVHSYSCNPSPVQLWTTGQPTSSTTWSNPGPRGLPLGYLYDTESYGYGYNASCPQHDAAWDATAAMRKISAAGLDSINLGLIASDESSPTGWKKFAPHASLIIDYGATPTTPNGRHVSPCFSICGVGTTYGLTSSPNPTLWAQSTVADSGEHLTYYVRTCPGTPSTASASDPACKTFQTDGSALSGKSTPIQVPSNTSIPEGSWVYQVKACDSLLCSPLTNWFPYTVDHTAPLAPTASSTQIDLELDPAQTTAQGAEGQLVKFTIHPPASASIADYVFSGKQDSFGGLASPTCHRISGDYSIVCPDATSQSFTTSTVSASWHLTLWAVDQAGNVSAAREYYYLTNAPPPLYGQGHNWIMTSDSPGQATNANTIQLADANLHTSASLPLTVTAPNGLTWDVAGDPASPPAAPNLTNDADMPQSHQAALSFDGTTAGSTASDTTYAPVSIDSTHSFAIFAWVKPADPDATPQDRAIVSQNTPYSNFVLKERADSAWAFCLSTATNTAASVCAVSAHLKAVPNQWTMVEGVWDASSKTVEVRVRVYLAGGTTSGNDTDPASAENVVNGTYSTPPTTESNADASAPIVIGRANANGSPVSFWKGDLMDPYLLVSTTGDEFAQNLSTDTTFNLWQNLPGTG